MKNVQRELHRLVEALDCGSAKEELHTEVDDLDEEQAHEAMSRLRRRRQPLEQHGFSM